MKLKSLYKDFVEQNNAIPLFVVVFHNAVADLVVTKIVCFPKCEIFVFWTFSDEFVGPKIEIERAEMDGVSSEGIATMKGRDDGFLYQVVCRNGPEN